MLPESHIQEGNILHKELWPLMQGAQDGASWVASFHQNHHGLWWIYSLIMFNMGKQPTSNNL